MELTRKLRALISGILVLAAALGGITQASASDVETLRSRAQEVADQVSSFEHRLSDLELEQARLEDEIASADRELAELDLERHRREEDFLEAQASYVDRAVEAYKAGAMGGQLELLLSARTLPEMLTLVEASQQAASLDSDELDDLVEARREADRAKDRIDVRKERLIASRERVATISTEISGTLEERRLALKQMSERLADLERQARRAAAQDPGTDALERLLAGTGPSGSGPSNGIPAGFVGTGVTFEGIASWYGPGFEGNHTANGDIFDSSLFTAASKTLPLGSWLYVEHAGRGVVVYVNDRGPYAGDRILDLSQAAAQAIGISGLGWIEAEVVLKK